MALAIAKASYEPKYQLDGAYIKRIFGHFAKITGLKINFIGIMAENFESKKFVEFIYGKMEELAKGKITPNEASAICKMAGQINMAATNELKARELDLKERALEEYLKMGVSGSAVTPGSFARLLGR